MERLDFLLRNAQSTLTYENIKDIIFYAMSKVWDNSSHIKYKIQPSKFVVENELL